MTADRKIFGAVFVDRNAEVVLLHQISKSKTNLNLNKNENKWSVISGQWSVESD